MNKIKTYTLKGLFVLISAILMLSVLNVVSYLVTSRPEDTFVDYSINFMKFGVVTLGYMILICGIVYVMMHYITKIYKKLFVKS